MFNRPSYQVAYANFVDQHQVMPMTPQNTTQHSAAEFSLGDVDLQFQKAPRTRITFTFLQQSTLELEFQNSAYLHKSRRIEIAERLGIGENNVKVWFQNRRMKNKREILTNGNKITTQCKPQTTLIPIKKASQSIPLTRSTPEKHIAVNSSELPVHKPTTAQVVKGISLSPTKIPKVFKPQLVVQMPNRTQPTKQPVSTISPQVTLEKPVEIIVVQTPNAPNQFKILTNFSIPTSQQAKQIPVQSQPRMSSHQQPQLETQQFKAQQQVQKQSQQTRTTLKCELPTHLKINHPVPKLELKSKSNTLYNPPQPETECPEEESVDLDAYLNDIAKRVDAQRSEKIETQEYYSESNKVLNNSNAYLSDIPQVKEVQKSVTEYPSLTMDEDDFNLADMIENLNTSFDASDTDDLFKIAFNAIQNDDIFKIPLNGNHDDIFKMHLHPDYDAIFKTPTSPDLYQTSSTQLQNDIFYTPSIPELKVSDTYPGMEDCGYDMKDIMENLDKYVIYPGSSPQPPITQSDSMIQSDEDFIANLMSSEMSNFL